MKLLKSALLMSSMLVAFSCASTADHGCCDPQGPKACAQGQCKLDKSCCKNTCGNCSGEKSACSTGQCKLHRKKKS